MRLFAMMRHAADVEAVWQASPRMSRHRTELDELRRRTGVRDVTRYRGTGRFPFSEAEEFFTCWGLAACEGQEDPELEARLWMQILLGDDDPEGHYPRTGSSTLDELAEVRDGLTEPNSWEVVELCRAPKRPRRLLGFDVGYWGGGNFSILCDAVLWPTWHPPEPEALARLESFVGQLNEHLLFPTAELAREYHAWYATQDWAEKPPEDFHVIAVGAVDPPEWGE